MSFKRILIVNKTFPVASLKLLENSPNVKTTVLPYADYDPEIWPEIKKNIKGYDALVWNTKYKLTPELLDLAGPSLKVVTTVSSGLDHVDVEEIKSRDIRLGHVLTVMDNSVADAAVGLMLGAARKFKEGLDDINKGNWKIGIQWNLGLDVAGSTVGVVGLGGIGQTIVRRLKGFDVARFLYCGRSDKPEAKSLGVDRVPLKQLLKESDFIVLACPLNEETKHMINAESIKLMKNTAVIVNIGRGGVIDHDALYDALKEKRIFAAGLDVVTPEPIPKDHPLALLPNCLIMPHIGSATVYTRTAMGEVAAKNLLLALDGKPMICPVC